MAEKTGVSVGWLGRVERAAREVRSAGKEVRGAVVWWVCTGEPVGWSVWGPLLDGLPRGR
ncbi:hypothetical protein [Microbacterium maritypicum]|uniref:hypothetical protein n=1 Tax=Microbacterium maritypicum TaxID=33918 RepID=UPI003808EED8